MLVGEGCAHIASSMSCVAESSPVMLRHSAMNLLAIRPGLALLYPFQFFTPVADHIYPVCWPLAFICKGNFCCTLTHPSYNRNISIGLANCFTARLRVP
jgi:hypothetical protein